MATVVDIFEINVQPIADQLNSLSQDISATKDVLKQLTDENKQYTEEGIAVTASLKSQQKEYRSLETVLVNQAGAIKEVTKAQSQEVDLRKISDNSIDTNRKLYNSLYGEYVRMSAEQRSKTIPTLKALSEELKKQEGAVGDTRRNVGNYAEGFKSALGDLNAFGVSTGSITKGLDAAKSGFMAAGGGVKGFSAALATTGLPFIIMAIQQLINLFENFAPVADAVENAVQGVKDAFGALIGGGSMAEAVKQGQELLEVMRDLEDTEKAYAIANEQARNKIEKLITQSKDRGKTDRERIAIIDEANKVEEKAFKESISRNEVLLKKQQEIFSSKVRLNGEELDLLTKGTSKEALELRTRIEQNTRFDKKELEAIQDGLKKRAELEGQSLTLQEKLVNRRNSLLESISADQERANEKAKEQEQKRLEERKKHLDELKKAQEVYNKNFEALIDEFYSTEREKLEKSYEKKFESITGNSAKEVALRNEIERKKLEALAKYDEEAQKKIEAQRKKNVDTEKAIEAKKFNDKIEQNKRSLDLELEAVDLSVGTEQEKANRKREVQLNALQGQLALTREYFGADGVITQAELDGIQKIENAIAKAKKGVQQKEGNKIADALGIDEQSLSDAGKIASGFQQLIGSIQQTFAIIQQQKIDEIDNQYDAEIDGINRSTISKEEKEKKIAELEKKRAQEKYEQELKGFNTSKALQITNAIIATAIAVIQGLQAGFSIPVAGVALGPALAAAAGIAGAAQIAVIAQQKPPSPPKFAKGVIGLDGAGNGTSDSIDAKLSRGESVMTARATERFAPMLAQMEMAVGNKPNFQLGKHRFATGYIPTSDGGYYARSASASMMNNTEIVRGFESAVKRMPSPTLNYNEFSQFTNSVENSVAISEL